jgi:dienelactone hydrolase
VPYSTHDDDSQPVPRRSWGRNAVEFGDGAVVVGVEGADDDLSTLRSAVEAQGGRWLLENDLADVTRRLDECLRDETTAGVALCAFGSTVQIALWSAADHGDVAALVLTQPELDEASIELIGEWPELPIFAIAHKRQDGALRSAVDAYLASTHPASELLVGALDEESAGIVARWLAERMALRASVEEVAIATSDGWELYGSLRLPGASDPVPGVVLLHSARSDRAVYSRLERLLAEVGIAVLNLDWRGRGQSVGRGTLWTLSEEERAQSWRDGLAGLEALASRPEIDAGRLGLLGSAQGAEIAVRAAMRDSRAKAIAILTGYQPADSDEERYLTGGTADFLYVTSSDHVERTVAMHRMYEQAMGARTRYLEYPGSALGYQLFDVDPGLEPAITAWFVEVLSR